MAEAAEGGDAGDMPNTDVKVKKAMVAKAIKALVQVVSKKTANTNPLFAETTETMTLQFALTKIPERRMRPVIIKLPYPMYSEKSEVCFISKSPQKKYKELLLQQHPVPGLTKVIGLEKLKKNYRAPSDKRSLADAFDVFLCDHRIVEMMPKTLGIVFYKYKLKPPIPVRLQEGKADPKKEIEKALAGTPFRMSSGVCVGVRFGRCSMPEEQLAANAAAVIASSIKLLNQKGIMLQSISIQATDNPALPVWRRKAPPGQRLNLKKYRDASSAASDTGASGVSDSEITGSDITSDAGETLSTRDTVSEVDTAGETMSELDSAAETFSEIDEDEEVVPKEALPLVQGLKKKKRRRDGSEAAAAAAAAVAEEPAAAPKKKAKKKGKAAA